MPDYHEWNPVETVSANALNTHLRDPMNATKNRRRVIKHLYNPTAGYDTWTTSFFQPVKPEPWQVEMECDGRLVLIMTQAVLSHTVTGTGIYMDIWVPELGIYVSTNSASFATWTSWQGYWGAANHYMTINFMLPWKPPVEQPQILTFVWRFVAGASTASQRSDLGYTMIGVMEA